MYRVTWKDSPEGTKSAELADLASANSFVYDLKVYGATDIQVIKLEGSQA